MEDNSDFKQNIQYRLSIRFSSDGFSLLVHDKTNLLISSKKVAAPLFSITKNELIEIIEKETGDLLNYSDIRIICELDNYVFVPAPLFEIGNESDFFQLEHKLDIKDCILFNEIASWETVNIFSIPKNLKDAFTHLFKNRPIEHNLSYFLTDQVKQRNDTVAQIWVRPTLMDIVLLVNGNIHLINSFTYNTPEDFTYYTLNLYEQLSLDTDTCKVKLFNVGGNNVIQKMLQKYVKQVEVIS